MDDKGTTIKDDKGTDAFIAGFYFETRYYSGRKIHQHAGVKRFPGF
jgi:hypothetical protein